MSFKRSSMTRKIIKLIIIGALLIFIALIILFVIVSIVAMNYHGQIYEGFLRIINFIFGDSSVKVAT